MPPHVLKTALIIHQLLKPSLSHLIQVPQVLLLCLVIFSSFPVLLAHWMDWTVLVCYGDLHRAVLSAFQVPRETPSAARHTGPFYFLFSLLPSLPHLRFLLSSSATARCLIPGLPYKGRGRTIDGAVSVLALGYSEYMSACIDVYISFWQRKA